MAALWLYRCRPRLSLRYRARPQLLASWRPLLLPVPLRRLQLPVPLQRLRSPVPLRRLQLLVLLQRLPSHDQLFLFLLQFQVQLWRRYLGAFLRLPLLALQPLLVLLPLRVLLLWSLQPQVHRQA